jgi:hypothetical protein
MSSSRGLGSSLPGGHPSPGGAPVASVLRFRNRIGYPANCVAAARWSMNWNRFGPKSLRSMAGDLR